MRRMMTAGVLAAITLVGCGGESEPDVNPIVADRIDALATLGNCRALQAEFDQADTNRNVDIMEYVDDALDSAGCYD